MEHKKFRIFCLCAYVTALDEPPIFWIGLKDVTGNNDDYRWTRDGANLTYTNWGTNQPNSIQEECVVVFNFHPFNFTWNDISCTRRFSALCESDRVSRTSFLK